MNTSLASDILPARTVAVIAARYGFDPAERVVTENADQARQYHGKPCGRSENGRDGAYDAVKLLDSYLAQESYTGQCGSGNPMEPTMPSTNAALALAGYTTAPSPSYGLKLILKDGEPVGHFDCQTAWTLPGLKEAGSLLDIRLSVFDRFCVLAMRSGQPLSEHEIDVARRLILVGATNPEAVLAEVRVVLAAQ